MTALRVMRVLALVATAVALALVADARLRVAAVQQRRDCVSERAAELSRQYQRNYRPLAMRACNIEDPAPHLPVGEPVRRQP